VETAKEATPQTAFGRELASAGSDCLDLAELSESLLKALLEHGRFRELVRVRETHANLAANLLKTVERCLRQAQENLEFLGYTDRGANG
jgi:hypothetical protein